MMDLDFLLPEVVAPGAVFRYGSVTSTDPLRIRLDGDDIELPIVPVLACPVGTADRVLLLLNGRQLIVVGRVGGHGAMVELSGSGLNLNNYDKPGLFHVARSADAVAGTNFPVGSAGLLLTERSPVDAYVYQFYFQYNTDSLWKRTRYSGNWYAWGRVLTEDQNGKAATRKIHITDVTDVSETSVNNPFQLGPDGGNRIVMDQNEFLVLNGTAYANFYIQALQLQLNGRASGTSFGPYLADPGSGGAAGLKVSGSSPYFQVENMWTTTSAANCYVNTSGSMYRSTSVRAAKLAIEDMPEGVLDALLQVQPRTWFDRRDSEQLADLLTAEFAGEDLVEPTESGPLKRQVGVVAEELEALGLEMFLLRGADGELEGVAYDRIGPAALALIRRLQSQVDAQAGQIAQQAARLQVIEAHLGLAPEGA